MDHLNKMFGTQGEDVIACIGPSISLESFEVGDEVYDAFEESGFDMSLISMKKKETGKYHIDLWEANRIELLNLGVPAEQIEVGEYSHPLIMMNSFSRMKSENIPVVHWGE